MTTPFRFGNRAFPPILCLALIACAAAGFAAEGAEGTHHVDNAARMKDFGWRVFNFAVLVAIFWWALAKAKVKKALSERQALIQRSLLEAQQTRDAAEQKLRDYSEKLEQASREMEELRAAIIREGEQEKERIIASARLAAERIATQAALSARQELLRARMELKAEAGRLAVELATAKLAGALTRDDHDRLVADHIGKVGEPR